MRDPVTLSLNFVRGGLVRAAILALGIQLLPLAAHAQGMPEISPALKKMLGGLPLADLKDDVQQMVGALKKTSCGGGLTGCYMTKSGALHLYFFTSKQAQQTFLLVIDKKMPLPHLLKDNVQQIMGGTALSSPIISISTTDIQLDISKMPPELQQVVKNSYFGVSSLEFASGVQLAARAELGGTIKSTMAALGVRGDQLTMRAAVVMPIPTDLAGGAGAGAGLADAASHGDTMKKAGADALSPEAFVEFQFAPDARLPMLLPPVVLTDATFFINNSLTIGYKGNASFPGVPSSKTLLQFQTPLTPLGAMDLLDFQLRMSTPPSLTLEDVIHIMAAMASPDPRLARYGGGFIRDIESLKAPLFAAAKPLSAFQARNPVPHPDYKFGDSTKPFPMDAKYFNIALLGPTSGGGPLMKFASDTSVLGLRMGSMDVLADVNGFSGKVVNDLTLKLGPLGPVTIQKMIAETTVNKGSQLIRIKGNYYGQVVEVILSGPTLAISVPANCVNPFEIKAKLEFQPSTNLADVFAAQGGANVDPSSITGCIGKDLEKALNKIANEYKHLGGYSANEANKQLKRISDDAAAAAAKASADAAAHAADVARQAKDAARNAAENAAHDAKNEFNNAGNSIRRAFGGKKKKSNDANDIFDPSVFDWEYYYDTRGAAWGKTDLIAYWRSTGFAAGERGSREFWMQDYRRRYSYLHGPDKDVLNHWLKDGINQGLQASPDFSITAYKQRYASELGRWSSRDVYNHWMENGKFEGRDSRP